MIDFTSITFTDSFHCILNNARTFLALSTNFASMDVFPWPTSPDKHISKLSSSSFCQNFGSPIKNKNHDRKDFVKLGAYLCFFVPFSNKFFFLLIWLLMCCSNICGILSLMLVIWIQSTLNGIFSSEHNAPYNQKI